MGRKFPDTYTFPILLTNLVPNHNYSLPECSIRFYPYLSDSIMFYPCLPDSIRFHVLFRNVLFASGTFRHSSNFQLAQWPNDRHSINSLRSGHSLGPGYKDTRFYSIEAVLNGGWSVRTLLRLYSIGVVCAHCIEAALNGVVLYKYSLEDASFAFHPPLLPLSSLLHIMSSSSSDSYTAPPQATYPHSKVRFLLLAFV
jgi:hypothetical protein